MPWGLSTRVGEGRLTLDRYHPVGWVVGNQGGHVFYVEYYHCLFGFISNSPFGAVFSAKATLRAIVPIVLPIRYLK